MARNIDVTVAAIVERDDRFLLVEELVAGKAVLNQPAGHLESGESLPDAVARETLEETGYRFDPTHLVGIYLWRCETGTTILRVVFAGTHAPPTKPPRLDEGIVQVHWLTRSQILGRERELRSPLVLRCLDDYLAGVRHPLDVLAYLETSLRAQATGAS